MWHVSFFLSLFTETTASSNCNFGLKVLNDFLLLHTVERNYECLGGKDQMHLQKWPDFVECVNNIVRNDEVSGLTPKEKRRFLSAAPNESTPKHLYILLQTSFSKSVSLLTSRMIPQMIKLIKM